MKSIDISTDVNRSRFISFYFSVRECVKSSLWGYVLNFSTSQIVRQFSTDIKLKDQVFVTRLVESGMSLLHEPFSPLLVEEGADLDTYFFGTRVILSYLKIDMCWVNWTSRFYTFRFRTLLYLNNLFPTNLLVGIWHRNIPVFRLVLISYETVTFSTS